MLPAGRKSIGPPPGCWFVGVQLIVAVRERSTTVSVPGVARTYVTVPEAVVGVPTNACASASCDAKAVAASATEAQPIISDLRVR